MEDAIKKRLKALAGVLEKLPPSIPLKTTGRPTCPWCGYEHNTITFAENTCDDCGRPFLFGYPDWADEKDCPMAWVRLRWDEEALAIENPHLLPAWKPNDRIKKLQHQMAIETTGQEGRA